MIFLYKILVYFLLILCSPFLALLWVFSEKRRANLLQRLGWRTGILGAASGEKSIWIHALSVGETASAVPLARELKHRHPNTRIVLTASTRTGFETAHRLMGQGKDGLVSEIGYFPFDIGFSINRVRRKINPACVILIETDLWPGFLHEMRTHHVPVLLVNARLSEKSLHGYLRFGFFFQPLFSKFKKVLVQSELDSTRFRQLGLDRALVTVAGNLKFDQMPALPGAEQVEALRQQLGIPTGQAVLVGGSTHDGEEDVLLGIFSSLRQQFHEPVLVLAPRDPLRSAGLAVAAEKHGLHPVLMSETDTLAAKSADVILVDRMGVLAKLYAIADAAFIGGSLVSEGGHNPLEAAAVSCPVCFGPDMSDFVEIADLLIQGGGAVQVHDAAELEMLFSEWLQHREKRVLAGENGRAVFLTHAGAADRIVHVLEEMHFV